MKMFTFLREKRNTNSRSSRRLDVVNKTKKWVGAHLPVRGKPTLPPTSPVVESSYPSPMVSLTTDPFFHPIAVTPNEILLPFMGGVFMMLLTLLLHITQLRSRRSEKRQLKKKSALSTITEESSSATVSEIIEPMNETTDKGDNDSVEAWSSSSSVSSHSHETEAVDHDSLLPEDADEHLERVLTYEWVRNTPEKARAPVSSPSKKDVPTSAKDHSSKYTKAVMISAVAATALLLVNRNKR